ncbi:hypothetical protein PUN28_010021 [Cardiocondyla obscurior]
MARASSSSEPYLDMQSGPKSLLLRNEGDLEEYVGMEESNSCTNTQDYYYETFDNKNQAMSVRREEDNEQDEAQVLISIYKNLSAVQVRSKCHKCGPLHRKEGKKLFLSESRACWIALVGSHLLIYRSERQNQPHTIYPIHGYMARPAPNVVPRNRRKSESAFEIYSPGNETLQFIARTPEDMEQWVTKICEVERNRNESVENKDREKKKYAVESTSINRCKNNDETTFVNDKSTVAKDELAKRNNKDQVRRKNLREKNGKEKAPPLPARIPRKLPSLPPTNSSLTMSSSKVTIEAENKNCNDEDEDDDDDIYHRIEDLRNKTRYENLVLLKKRQADDEERDERQKETYDDVLTSKEKSRSDSQAQEAKSYDTKSLQETYDDIVGFSRLETASVELKQSRNNETSVADHEKKEGTYDDVQNLIPNRKIIKSPVKNQIEASNKLQKKSFLDRVLSRGESPVKPDKKERHCNKNKVSSSSLDVEEMPTYDDVSDLTANQESLAVGGEELPEYNCPPPPRPIYEKRLPAESESNLNETQEFYDNILNAYPEHDKTDQKISPQSHKKSAKETVCEIIQKAESKANGSSTEEEVEHYQSPKSDLCVCDPMQMNQNDYDDITLWTNFMTRRRDFSFFEKNDDSKSGSSDKKYWSRFAVNKKTRFTTDFSCAAETNKRGGNEASDEIDSFENNGPVKKNTFQKLISRMENSLSKVSIRSSSSLSTGKPSISNSSL